MILLLGGTGVTAEIALGLARGGYRVLVSRATDVPLDVGQHAGIESRWGELDDRGLAELIAQRKTSRWSMPRILTRRSSTAPRGGPPRR